jgi:hypothetical protein
MGSPAQIQAWAGPRRLDQPLAGAGQAGEMIPAAFLGRCSTFEQQDPTLSLPRQLRRSQRHYRTP